MRGFAKPFAYKRKSHPQIQMFGVDIIFCFALFCFDYFSAFVAIAVIALVIE